MFKLKVVCPKYGNARASNGSNGVVGTLLNKASQTDEPIFRHHHLVQEGEKLGRTAAKRTKNSPITMFHPLPIPPNKNCRQHKL